MTDTPGTIYETAAALRQGTLTSVELTKQLLARADAVDPIIGTYVRRFDESAVAAAEQADRELAAGIDRGPLQGIPLGIKDVISTEDGPTTGQSLVLDPRWGDQSDAPVVARLRASGAVMMGKTTTNEFAVGLPDPSKPFPIPLNPWNTSRWSGGSSAGTANGVSAGLLLGGLGTDTGGSVRLPSANSGVTGLKPTFGRVPKTGCIPLGYSLDVVGPLARTAQDCALMLNVMAGFDASDPNSAATPVPDYLEALGGSVDRVRIGVEREHHSRSTSIDPDTAARFEEAVKILERAGAIITEVVFPFYEEIKTATWLVLLSEALAYHRENLRERWMDFVASSRTALATAAFYSGADYVQAQRVRALARAAIGEIFEGCDVVMTPTASGGAPPPDVDMGTLAATIYTFVWNAVGFPAASVPMGFDHEGMPLGLQIAGRPFAEGEVLHVADAYQQLTDWHLRRPPMPPQ